MACTLGIELLTAQHLRHEDPESTSAAVHAVATTAFDTICIQHRSTDAKADGLQKARWFLMQHSCTRSALEHIGNTIPVQPCLQTPDNNSQEAENNGTQELMDYLTGKVERSEKIQLMAPELILPAVKFTETNSFPL